MRRAFVISMAVLIVAALCAGPANALPVPNVGRDPDQLDAYTAVVRPTSWRPGRRQGHDVGGAAAGRQRHRGRPGAQPRRRRDDLRSQGIKLQLTRVKGGKTVQQFAAAQAADGFTVWRSYDEPGGIRDQMYAVARNNPQLAKLVKLGHDVQGREILAVKLTQGARGTPDGTPPGGALQRHPARARVDRHRGRPPADEPLHRQVARQRPGGQEAAADDRALVHPRRQPGRLPVHVRPRAAVAQEPARQRRRRPDHRSATASTRTATSPTTGATTTRARRRSRPARPTAARRRRRSPRPRRWSACSTGSASRSRSTTTPTASGCSTPRAGRSARRPPTTRSTTRMSGNLDKPGDRGLPPGPELGRPLRHQRRDHRLRARAATARWPGPRSCPRAATAAGSSSPTTRRWCRRSSSATCRSPSRWRDSAVDPDDPKSVTGIKTKPFYLDSDDPYKSGIPGVQLSFTNSYGDPQPVAVLAKRSLGAVTAKYRINGGRVQSAPTSEWNGGVDVRPGVGLLPPDARRRHAAPSPATRSRSGSRAAARRSESFTYDAVVRDPQPRARGGGRGLHRAPRRCRTAGPHYADVLRRRAGRQRRAGRTSTTSTRRGGSRPTRSACSATTTRSIWETGDDIVTRTAGRAGGNADRLALDEMLEFRAYLNEGGKVLLDRRQRRPAVHRRNVGDPALRPEGRDRLQPAARRRRPAAVPAAARLGRRRPNDVLQYYLGGYLAVRRRRPRRATATPSTWSASTTRSPGCPGASTAPTAPTTRPTRRRSSRRAASCRPTSSRSSRAGRRRGGTSPAARSTRTPATSTCTRRSPTSPTSG